MSYENSEVWTPILKALANHRQQAIRDHMRYAPARFNEGNVEDLKGSYHGVIYSCRGQEKLTMQWRSKLS